MKRLVASAVLAAAAFGMAPSAHAVGCLLPGFEYEPSGFYHPLTGQPIETCQYHPDGVL